MKNKKLISLLMTTAMLLSSFSGFSVSAADELAIESAYIAGDSVKVTITGEGSAVLIGAEYAGGVLTSVDSEVVTAADVYTLDVDPANSKIMLWRSLDDMYPISDVTVAVEQPIENGILWTCSAEDGTKAAGDLLAENLYVMFDPTSSDETTGYVAFDEYITIDGKTFSGYISSTSMNGGWSGTTVKDGYWTNLKFVAPADGTVDAYLSTIGSASSSKTAYIVEDGKTLANSSASYTGNGESAKLSGNVEAGKTYYIFVDGSKGRFVGFNFNEGDYIEPTEAPEAEREENQWLATADDVAVVTGDTLMTSGLTSLFDVSKTGKAAVTVNGVTFTNYITGANNPSWSESAAPGGTSMKFQPSQSGVLTVYYYQLGASKEVIIAQHGRANNAITVVEDTKCAYYKNETGAKENGYIQINCEADKTYYAFGKGTKLQFMGATFEPGKSIVVGGEEEELTDEWICDTADGLKANGDYLMLNLSLMFDVSDAGAKSGSNTFEDGTETSYYISGTNNAVWSEATLMGAVDEATGEELDPTALLYEADRDGTLTVYIHQLGIGKSVAITREGVEDNTEVLEYDAAYYTNETEAKESVAISLDVAEGEVYYIYGVETKAGFAGARFTEAE